MPHTHYHNLHVRWPEGRVGARGCPFCLVLEREARERNRTTGVARDAPEPPEHTKSTGHGGSGGAATGKQSAKTDILVLLVYFLRVVIVTRAAYSHHTIAPGVKLSLALVRLPGFSRPQGGPGVKNNVFIRLMSGFPRYAPLCPTYRLPCSTALT